VLGAGWAVDPPSCPPEQVKIARARYEARDVTVAEIAKALGVGRGTIYRALQQTPVGALPMSSGNVTTTDFDQNGPGSGGDHLNGSFPSDSDGNPVSDGTTTAASWTAATHTGGVDSPNTYSDVWALCVTDGA
jgi:Bacterial regulatory proteins, tetR family